MKLLNVLFIAAVLFASAPAFGQFGHYRHQSYRPYSSYGDVGKRWLKREYIGLNVAFMNLQLDTKMKINRDSMNGYNKPGRSVDTAIYLNRKSSSSYGISFGTFFPIAKINPMQMIALDWSAGFYWYSFDIGQVSYSPKDSLTSKSQYIIVDMPFILQYKSGGEVELDPKNKTLFSMGAGFAPTVSLGGYETAATAAFKLRPVLMAEIGMHFGFAMKIKCLYYPGIIALLSDEVEGVNEHTKGYGIFKATGTGSGNFVLSLVFLPRSMKWGDNIY